MLPSLQTVEVVRDYNLQSNAVAALKGDFVIEGASIREDYGWMEFGGQKQFDTTPSPRTLKCTYLSPTMRVARTDDGAAWVYAKAESDACMTEIGELIEEPVLLDDGEGNLEEVDDRPLWQKRIDEENARAGHDGDSNYE